MAGATLYIDGLNTDLRTEGAALILRREGKRVSSVPLSMVDRLVVPGNATFDARTVRKLAERGIALLFTSPRSGLAKARLTGPGHSDAGIRLAQYRAACDGQFTRRWAAALVRAKLQAQARTLERWASDRPAAGRPVKVAQGTISPAIERLRVAGSAGDLSLDTIRGIEGGAAAVYFKAMQQMFAPSLEFTARRRRPPPDPINAALSLAYTLAFNSVANQAWVRGLDPCIGFLHEPDWKRESLAADLVEPVRPLIDAWVVGAFAQRKIRKEHFSTKDGSCLLGKAGREHFYREYEGVRAVSGRMTERLCTLLIRQLRVGDAKDPATLLAGYDDGVISGSSREEAVS